MFEFHVILPDGTNDILWRYSLKDACKRNKTPLNPEEVKVWLQYYID